MVAEKDFLSMTQSVLFLAIDDTQGIDWNKVSWYDQKWGNRVI